MNHPPVGQPLPGPFAAHLPRTGSPRYDRRCHTTRTGVQILTGPLTSCVTLGKFPHFSELYFHHLKMGTKGHLPGIRERQLSCWAPTASPTHMAIDQALGQAHSKGGQFVHPNENDPLSMPRKSIATHRDPPSCHEVEHSMAKTS